MPQLNDLLQVSTLEALAEIGLNFNGTQLARAKNRHPDAPIFKLLDRYSGKTLRERAYVALYGGGQCKTCGKATAFYGVTRGFADFCSTTCVHRNVELQTELAARRSNTMLHRYGARGTLAIPALRAKAEQHPNFVNAHKNSQSALIQQYGRPTPASKQVAAKAAATRRLNTLTRHIAAAATAGYQLVGEWESFDAPSKWRHTCGHEFVHSWTTAQRLPICRRCTPVTKGTSSDEQELAAWLENIGASVTRNVRIALPNSYRELDVVCNGLVAIEYNGLFWHSELAGKGPDYHLKKLELAQAAGYRLIQIFEHEWKLRREAVEQVLLNKLGLAPRGPGARKLKLETISTVTAAEWLERHHLAGSARSTLALALSDDNTFRAVATFAPNRFGTNKQVLELVRFATDGSSIPGALSRLSKRALELTGAPELRSFCDRRWGDGAGYVAAGFELTGLTAPGYWYFTNRPLAVYHRSRFTRAKLRALLSSNTGSEWELAQLYGLNRFWDCGHLIFTLKR